MSEFAKQVAAQCWCDPRTSGIEMDVRLAEVFAEKLDQYIEALHWCSGSRDFSPGGQAREGWIKVQKELLTP